MRMAVDKAVVAFEVALISKEQMQPIYYNSNYSASEVYISNA